MFNADSFHLPPGFVAFYYDPVGYMDECCETNAAVRLSPVPYFLAPIDPVRAA